MYNYIYMHTQARAYKEGAFTPLQSLFFWCEDQMCQQGLLLRDAPQSCQWRGEHPQELDIKMSKC